MNKELFENVVIYSFSEPGAMGAGGYMEFVTATGEEFDLCYLLDETPYQEIKSLFPALKDCYWNGPMESRAENEPEEIVLYPESEDCSNKRTTITEGWRHIYMGFGNHLVIRIDCYDEFKNAIRDLTEEVQIYGNWRKRAIKLYRE